MLGRKFIKVKIFPEMVLFKAHMMFKCFFHLINAKEESLDLKSIILLVKKIAFLKTDNPVVRNSFDIAQSCFTIDIIFSGMSTETWHS